MMVVVKRRQPPCGVFQNRGEDEEIVDGGYVRPHRIIRNTAIEWNGTLPLREFWSVSLVSDIYITMMEHYRYLKYVFMDEASNPP